MYLLISYYYNGNNIFVIKLEQSVLFLFIKLGGKRIMEEITENTLFYGDNLEILRDYIPDESVDLIYIDPPFNSKRNYNVLFTEQNGSQSSSQIRAFDDTWNWGEQAERAFLEIQEKCSPKLVEMLLSVVNFIGRNDITAYLVMMAIRLVELNRVLKSTGSIYLHCDPTASHYLKILMDVIFSGYFRNEIIWHYSGWNAKLKHSFNSRHDVLLYYSKRDPKFNSYSIPWENEEEYIKKRKQKVHVDGDDKKYVLSDGGGGKRVKRFLFDAMEYGKPVDDVWDIDKINNSSKEHLGYPTQKPLALLERIVEASSDKGDIVLDAFCGCGSSIDASQKLNRRWIGIDITHIAINLIKYRLQNRYHLTENKDYKVIGEPKDLGSAKTLALHDRYQFEWWALGLIKAKPYQDKKKGADTGVDGISYFQYGKKATEIKSIIVQIKSGKVSVKDIRELNTVVDNKKGAIGILITLEEPTKPMTIEAVSKGFYEHPLSGKKYPKIQIYTIKELLDGKNIDTPSIMPFAKKAEGIGDRHKQEKMF